MNRREAYVLIKQYGLENTVKETYSDNYTRISTENLQKVIENYEDALHDEEYEDDEVAESKPEVKASNVENAYEAACLTFLGILEDNDLLDGLLNKL